MTEPLFEVATRDDTRPTVRGRPPVPRWAVLAALPAVLAALAVLVVPFGFTVWASLRTADGPAPYGALLRDDQVGTAARNSLAWVGFAVLLAVAGLGLAELIRRSGEARGLAVAVLAAPMAVSALVVGVAFRLIFDPDPDRGTVAALLALVRSGPDAPTGFLGPDGIALVLGSAFAWSWMGLAVVVLGAGLRAVPFDRLRMARAAGVGPARRLFSVVLQPIRPVLAVVALTLLVAASRVFDLVLVAVPGSVRQATDVVGLAWLRSADDLPPAERAALVVVLSLVLAGLAAGASFLGATRRWLAGAEPATVPVEPRRRPVRWLGAAAVWVVVGVWAVPFVVLVATSLRDPVAAARSGWWSGGDWSLASYEAAFAGGELTAALAGSATVATVATLVLLLLAVPAAYAFAWGGLRRGRARVVAAACAVLAVLPAQAYALPLAALVTRAQVLGAPTVLAVVHAVVGLPFAVLLLRGAFATVPPGEVVGNRLDGGELQAALAVVGARVWSVVAVAVLEFVLVWNDLVIGLLLGAPGTRLVSLALLGGSRQFTIDAGALSASAVVVTAVPLLLVLGTGRWLVRGLAAGVTR